MYNIIVSILGGAMYINIISNGKYKYVYINESYRENGKTKTRHVQKVGRYDLLEAKDPNFLKKLKAQYEEPRKLNEELKEERLNAMVAALDQVIEPDYSSNAAPLLCYGMEPVRAVWNNELKLGYRLNYLQEHYSEYEFNINDAVFYLTAFKLINPASISYAYDKRHQYLFSAAKDLKIYDLYRSLDFLQKYKEKIIKHLNQRVDEFTDRKFSMVFYDVTNAYFEAPLTDEEKNLLDKTNLDEIKEVVNNYLKEHGLPQLNELEKYIDKYDENMMELEICDPFKLFDDKGLPVLECFPEDLLSELKHLLFLRMRGLSKEHRYDLPLISIALVVDEQGFPVDYEIYSGDSSEFTTMKQSIEQIKNKYHVEDTVLVADRGLNSAKNLQMLLDNDYGFLVAQKVTNLPDEIRKLMLEEEGYQTLENIPGDKYRYRVIENFTKEDNKRTVQVQCTLVINFSKERQERDLLLLEKDRTEAMKAVENNQRISSKKKSWQQMVKIKDSSGSKAVSFNQELYEKRKAECGYAAMVYHKTPKEALPELKGEQIASAYHRLVRIEECFRILKTNIRLRPMYVYSPAHIKGYVMICYLSLLCYRTLEYKLNKAGTPLSFRRISNALKSACVAPFKINNEVMFLHTSTYDNINDSLLDRDEELAKSETNQHLHINIIMKAVNLTPLYKLNSTQNINSLLSRRGSIEDMICPELMDKI